MSPDPSRYTPADHEAVAEIKTWLAATGRSQGWLATVARLNKGTLSQTLNEVYPASPTKFLAQAQAAIRSQDDRASTRGVVFVETSVAKLARMAVERARTYRFISALVGRVGTGKTMALRQIAATEPNTFLVEAAPGMSAGFFLHALQMVVSGRRSDGRGSTEARFESLVEQLRGTEAVVILDEAETVHPRTLHYLRRLRDRAGIGAVMAGAEALVEIAGHDDGRFGQESSRTLFRPKAFRTISRDDADAIAQGAFPETDLEPALLDALWAICGGSARVLGEGLIPALYRYGVDRGQPVTPALAEQIATEILSLKPLRKAP